MDFGFLLKYTPKYTSDSNLLWFTVRIAVITTITTAVITDTATTNCCPCRCLYDSKNRGQQRQTSCSIKYKICTNLFDGIVRSRGEGDRGGRRKNRKLFFFCNKQRYNFFLSFLVFSFSSLKPLISLSMSTVSRYIF